MNRMAIVLSAMMASIVLAGCGTAARTIMANSQSERRDIFKEVPVSNQAPSGYVDVLIRASIKTHLEDYYIAEPGDQAHGKPTYPFLINIDGQSVVWNVPGVLDRKPAYDGDGQTSLDPEARDGMKYVLEKKVQIRTGRHRVFFGLSEEQYYIVADVEVKEGNAYVLDFLPVYRYKTSPTRIPSFFLGVSRYDVRLDSSARAMSNPGGVQMPAQP